MEPGALTISPKSCVPSLPSLKQTRRRKPPSFSRRVTLVSIETRDLLGRLSGPGTAPILPQFAAMRQRPLLHEAPSPPRELSFDDLSGLDGDVRLVFPVDSLKMRRRMVPNVHANRDAVE